MNAELNIGPIVDSRYLRSAERDVVVPFRIQLECDGLIIELVCTRILRILPRKRLVCLGQWNGWQVVAKFFLSPRCAKRHCSREERGVDALRNAGIKTPALLFKGLLEPDSTPILGFQRISQARDLAEAWKEAADDDRRCELLNLLITAIASQHEIGLKQDDLHMSNFLLVGDYIYTIDGASIDVRQMGRPLSKAESLKNLGRVYAKLYPRFAHLIPKSFRLYAENRGWQMWQDLYSRLVSEIRGHRNYRKSKYLKRVYRESSAFICRKTWHCFMVCDRDFQKVTMARFLNDLDSVIERSKLLKTGNTSTVALVDVSGHRLVIKRYSINSTWHAFKRGLRPSRAWVSWRNAHLLTFLGIPTPRPVLLLEKRWGPIRSTAYFITEYVEGTDAYHLLHLDKAEGVDKEGVARLFGELLQLLADASISHGDLKATNFVVANTRLFLTDLDAMCVHRFRWRFQLAFRRDCKRLIKNWEDITEVEQIFCAELKKFLS
jgi:tRNA A-37 threonylcarbamoyl transferase component Bud32